jgi:hypothetical protein
LLLSDATVTTATTTREANAQRTTMAAIRQRQATTMNRMIGATPYVAFVANTIFLLGFHVHADTESLPEATLWDRLLQGPEALNALDKVLFGVLILLAFELLDFITNHSGSKFLNY